MKETHTTIFPHASQAVHFHWRSTEEAAKFYGRTRRQIRNWCQDGTFSALNIPVFQDASRRWWVCIPPDNL